MRLPPVAFAAVLLTAAVCPALLAQRVEITTGIGYAAPAGTLFRLGSPPAEARAWDDGGVDVGATVGWWPGAHLGIQGGVDLRFTRYHEDYTDFCSGVTGTIPGCRSPDPVDGSARQVVASLRLAARRTLGDRLHLGASLGPAVIRFGAARYPSAYVIEGPCPSCAAIVGTNTYTPSGTVVALAVGVSAGYALTSRIRLSAAADDVIYRASPLGDVNGAHWTSVVTTPLHQLTFGTVLAATLP